MLIQSTRVHSGRVITLDRDTVRFPNGTEAILDTVRHPGAAAILPLLDPLDDPDPRVLLLRQFRHAGGGFLWEIPAGTLSPGEEPELCAARELEEEAGCRGRLAYLTQILVAPGYTDERIHLFLATDLVRGEARPEPDEFLSVHETRWSVVTGMIRRGEIIDAKSLVALLFARTLLAG